MDRSESIFLNAKKYHDIAEKRSVNFIEIEKAFELVKKFIIDKKRIIYGGMSLDLNLKLSGHPGIYSDNAIPDYDFMSPDFYNDSNELALILYKAGLPNVSAINAAHFNSRRVRVNFIAVADISYIPENIYNKLPKVLINNKFYKGMYIIHPDFQRMDLHRSFNIPYSNPPMEVILHRLEKDQKRFRLLDKQYPFKLDLKLLSIKPSLVLEIPKKYLQNTTIGGIVAYSIMLKFITSLVTGSAICKMLEKSGVSEWINLKLKEIIQIDLDITKDTIVIKSPEFVKLPINIITDNFVNLVNLISKDTSKPTYINRYLDNLRPRTIIMDNYEIFDNSGELLPVYNLQKSINIIKKLTSLNYPENNENIYIPHSNYLLLYFLQKSFEEDLIYRNLYQSLMHIIEIAEKIVLSLEEQDPELINKIYKYLPFFLSAKTYGDKNWSIDYIANMKEKISFLTGTEKETLRPPFGFYPEKITELNPSWPEFNLNTSELYLLDGSVRNNPFNPIDLNY